MTSALHTWRVSFRRCDVTVPADLLTPTALITAWRAHCAYDPKQEPDPSDVQAFHRWVEGSHIPDLVEDALEPEAVPWEIESGPEGEDLLSSAAFLSIMAPDPNAPTDGQLDVFGNVVVVDSAGAVTHERMNP